MTDPKDSEEKKDEERFVETLKRMHKLPPEPRKKKQGEPRTPEKRRDKPN